MNSEEFLKNGKLVADWMVNYQDTIANRPVLPTVEPGYLQKRIAKSPPADPQSFEQTLSEFRDKIVDGTVHWNHPRFHAYFSPGNPYCNVLADVLGCSTSAIGFSWFSNPAGTELETIMMDWTARALGLPEHFMADKSDFVGGGCLMGSECECNLVVTMAARSRVINELKKDNDDFHPSQYLPLLVAYSCDEAHSSVEKATNIALVQMRILKANKHGEMDVNVLRKAIEADLKKNLIPCLVVATLGTQRMGAFDNLDEIGRMLQDLKSKIEHPIWFHVDGAYGGAFLMIDENNHLKLGIERADSFNFDPNQQLLTTCDASCLWAKNVNEIKAGLTVNPYYLDEKYESKRQIDYRNYGVPLSRRFRSLKLWFLFQTYGLNGLKKYIRHLTSMTKILESLIKQDSRFEICTEVLASMVTIRYKEKPDLDRGAANTKMTKLIKIVNESRKIYVSGHERAGSTMMRIAVTYEFTTEQLITESWNMIKNFADQMD